MMLTLSWAGGGTLCPDNFETYIANFFALLTPHIIHWLFIFYCVIYGETLILGKKCILGPHGGVPKTQPPIFSFSKNDKSSSADQILHRIKKSSKQKTSILIISFWNISIAVLTFVSNKPLIHFAPGAWMYLPIKANWIQKTRTFIWYFILLVEQTLILCF